MAEQSPLEADLLRAGRTLDIEPVRDALTEDVLAAIAGSAPAHRRAPRWWNWLRARRHRLVTALVVALLLLAALTPPVRAAVLQWLRIGGVLITTGSTPAGTDTTTAPFPSSLPGSRQVTLDEVRVLVDFPVGVPAALGPPSRVTLSADDRVVGMDWTVDGRAVHLDQFDGSLSYAFLKRSWSELTPTDVAGADAAWLPEAHEVAYVDRTGIERRETARLSGPSLVWQPLLAGGRTTARLEGFDTLDAARRVAESLA